MTNKPEEESPAVFPTVTNISFRASQKKCAFF